jgi:hypothetical protein
MAEKTYLKFSNHLKKEIEVTDKRLLSIQKSLHKMALG